MSYPAEGYDSNDIILEGFDELLSMFGSVITGPSTGGTVAVFDPLDYITQGYSLGNFVLQGFELSDTAPVSSIDALDLIVQGYKNLDIVFQGYQAVEEEGDSGLPNATFVYGNIPGRVAFINRIDLPRTVNIKKPEETAFYDLVCSEDLFKGDKITSIESVYSSDSSIDFKSVAINDKQCGYKPYNFKAAIGTVIQLKIAGGEKTGAPVEIKVVYRTSSGQELEASLFLLIGYLQ